MFNIETLTEITGNSTHLANLNELTAEHCSSLLIAESTEDMARPIRRLSTNERIAIQQTFNRSIAIMVKKADNSTKDSLQELAMQAAMRVQAAQQAADDDATDDAIQRLERVINLFADLASNVARNSFYRYDECIRQQTPVADNKVDGIDGASGAYETRSKYAGWKQVMVEADVMQEAAEEAVSGILSVVKALLPMASAYLQSFMRNDKGEVTVQLGYRRQPEAKDGEVEYIQFYTLADVWRDITSNRKEAVAPMSAADAAAAFKL
jgi:hypothetical protein